MYKSLLLLCLLLSACSTKPDFTNWSFRYSEVTGIGHEQGVTRRDPSDIILANDTFYVYYTKIYGRSPGYWGTVWCAVSVDSGYTWTEIGEVLGKGNQGRFDSHAVFTPNILADGGKYYLYYTGVKPTPGDPANDFENNSTTDITAIGVAVSDSPRGPFRRVLENPILETANRPEDFDSYRVDDAALLVRQGRYWLYYKGRSRMHGAGGPAHTRMGVAFAGHPWGPFTKNGPAILDRSHEVLIWPQGSGVAALASLSSTFEYAPDGIHFDTTFSTKAKNRPIAPGLFRPDLTRPVRRGQSPDWGISMVLHGDECYLERFRIIRP
jgi:hypothetical protein